MKLLLDTHILLWTLSDDVQLPEKVRKLLENEENEVYYSLVSLWELQIKFLAHPGQMDFTAKQVADHCSESGFYRLPIREEHIFCLQYLKRPESAPAHKDPFDRLLICQAMEENMLFITHDHLIPDYNEPCIYSV